MTRDASTLAVTINRFEALLKNSVQATNHTDVASQSFHATQPSEISENLRATRSVAFRTYTPRYGPIQLDLKEVIECSVRVLGVQRHIYVHVGEHPDAREYFVKLSVTIDVKDRVVPELAHSRNSRGYL